MKLTYFGHSAFQIEVKGTTLLFDPFITGNPHCEGIVTADDLNPDVIILTHAHGDHWGDTPDIAKRTGALVVADFEIVQYLGREHGIENVHPMNTGGKKAFEWGTLHMTFARHSSSFPDGTYGGSPHGYILEADGKIVYNSGDTDRFSEMAWYGERFDIDVALLPIGDDFTMGPDEAVEAAKMVKAARTVPLHYGTFPLLTGDPRDFKRRMESAGLGVDVLDPGSSIEL
jgi:L-ascorbate metabolism protein UlaG (beta-lactamase superfamily)